MVRYFIDRNYPGVAYVLDDDLIKSFKEYMAEEGAALQKVDRPDDSDDVYVVTGIYQETEKWGLELSKTGSHDEYGCIESEDFTVEHKIEYAEDYLFEMQDEISGIRNRY